VSRYDDAYFEILVSSVDKVKEPSNGTGNLIPIIEFLSASLPLYPIFPFPSQLNAHAIPTCALIGCPMGKQTRSASSPRANTA
jgi:hypothetical protein